MRWVDSTTLLKAPEEVRELLYRSGVYMVNDCFTPLYTQKSFFKHLYGGRGSGKSHHACDYVDHLLSKPEYCRVLLLRYNLESVRESLWRGFIDRLEERNRTGQYYITDNNMKAVHKTTGNRLVSKGVKSTKSQTAKLKSIAGFTHVIIDEADELPPEDKRKLVDSIRKIGVEIEIVELWNTARKSHCIYDDYRLIPTEHDGYFLAEPKPGTNILSIHATYENNLHNLNDIYIKRYNELANNPNKLDYYLTDVKGYIPSGLTGNIYRGWSRISLQDYNQIEAAKTYYIDWGENHPAAIGEVKIANRRLYVKGLHYKPANTLEIGKFLCLKGFTTNELIICDSSEGKAIIALRGYTEEEVGAEVLQEYPQLKNGFTTVGVNKPPGSVLEGIKILKEYEVFVVEDEESEHIWNEYLEYRWELDKDLKPTDKPVKIKDDHMDGIRYVAYSRDNLL